MPAMIDYAVLCRAIEDWKAGNAPNIAAASYPVEVASETVVESYDAGEAEVDAGEVDAGEVDGGDVDGGDVDAGEGEVDAGDVDAGDVEAGYGDGSEQPQDRTIVYQMPEIVDEEEQA